VLRIKHVTQRREVVRVLQEGCADLLQGKSVTDIGLLPHVLEYIVTLTPRLAIYVAQIASAPVNATGNGHWRLVFEQCS